MRIIDWIMGIVFVSLLVVLLYLVCDFIVGILLFVSMGG